MTNDTFLKDYVDFKVIIDKLNQRLKELYTAGFSFKHLCDALKEVNIADYKQYWVFSEHPKRRFLIHFNKNDLIDDIEMQSVPTLCKGEYLKGVPVCLIDDVKSLYTALTDVNEHLFHIANLFIIATTFNKQTDPEFGMIFYTTAVNERYRRIINVDVDGVTPMEIILAIKAKVIDYLFDKYKVRI